MNFFKVLSFLFDKVTNKIDEMFIRKLSLTNVLELEISNGLVFKFLCKNSAFTCD
jgi:hypothetical protein